MYKKKEIIFLLIIAILFILGLLINKKEEESNVNILSNKSIIINVNGELARKTKLEYQNKTTYGSVFIRIKSLLNEYSDLSSFDLYEIIDKSVDITIPTLDVNNNYSHTSLIIINQATKEELMQLPQIGEKRSQAIIDYISKNGKIKTWDEFFKLVSVSDEYKEAIKKQAVL